MPTIKATITDLDGNICFQEKLVLPSNIIIENPVTFYGTTRELNDGVYTLYTMFDDYMRSCHGEEYFYKSLCNMVDFLHQLSIMIDPNWFIDGRYIQVEVLR